MDQESRRGEEDGHAAGAQALHGAPVGLSVLVVGVRWPPETFLARLIRGLLKAGIDVTVASDKQPGTDWLSEPNLAWLHAPAWNGSLAKRLLRLANMTGRVLARAPQDIRWVFSCVSGTDSLREQGKAGYRLLPFAGRRWDIVYFPWNTAAITYLPLVRLARGGVLSCRGSQVHVGAHDPRRAALREGMRLTFEQAAAVHCVSEAVKKEAVALGLDPSKAHVIRPAVDPGFFCPGAFPRPDRVTFQVVTTGTLNWKKGYEYALSALRRLLDRGIPAHLNIIGEGGERPRILYTMHDLELETHVRLLGHLPPEKVRDHLQRADVFVLSSLSEGISNAVLEAMACGLPVVTTDCGGMREAVTDGVEGFVVPMRDPDAMADALACLAAAPEQRRAMGTAGRQRIVEEFTLDRQIGQFVALLEEVSAEK